MTLEANRWRWPLAVLSLFAAAPATLLARIKYETYPPLLMVGILGLLLFVPLAALTLTVVATVSRSPPRLMHLKHRLDYEESVARILRRRPSSFEWLIGTPLNAASIALSLCARALALRAGAPAAVVALVVVPELPWSLIARSTKAGPIARAAFEAVVDLTVMGLVLKAEGIPLQSTLGVLLVGLPLVVRALDAGGRVAVIEDHRAAVYPVAGVLAAAALVAVGLARHESFTAVTLRSTAAFAGQIVSLALVILLGLAAKRLSGRLDLAAVGVALKALPLAAVACCVWLGSEVISAGTWVSALLLVVKGGVVVRVWPTPEQLR
jgi:hypothetical protein